MIVAVGSDLVDLARIERTLHAHRERFLERILTPLERAYCDRKAVPLPSIGARFAAKEAVMKCLGTGWSGGVRWRDIEVVRSEGGAPSIRLTGRALDWAKRRGIRTIHLSLTHTRDHALAMAVAES